MEIKIVLTEEEQQAVMEQEALESRGSNTLSAEELVSNKVQGYLLNILSKQKQRDLGSIDFSALSSKQIVDIKAVLSSK